VSSDTGILISLTRIASTASSVLDAGYSWASLDVVYVSACVCVAKTAEPIEMPFETFTRVGPRNYLIDGVHIPLTGGENLEVWAHWKHWGTLFCSAVRTNRDHSFTLGGNRYVVSGNERLVYSVTEGNKKHLKNVRPIRHASRRTPIQQMSLPVLSRSACASMSTTTTTTTTTTTGDRGDRYGPM